MNAPSGTAALPRFAGWSRNTLPSPFAAFSAVLSIGVIFLVLYPIAMLILRIFFKGGHLDVSALSVVLGSSWIGPTLLNTVIVVGAQSVLAVFIGALFAWLNERTDARVGMIGDVLPLVPLLLPAIGLAIGWIFLGYSGTGFINGWLKTILSPFGLSFGISITTWTGVIFVYTLHAVPYVYLIVGSAMRNLDPALEEASSVTGAGQLKTFLKVSLPAIKPALIAAWLLAVISGLSQYSIAVIVASRARIDVLSVRIMRMLTAEFPPKLDQAAIMSVLMLLTVGTIWALQRRLVSKGNFAVIGGKSTQRTIIHLGPWKWVARGGMLAYILCAAVLPLLALVIVALQPYWSSTINFRVMSLENFHSVFVERPITRLAFRNSLLLGAAGATAAMTVAVITSLYVRRAPPALGRLLDNVTKLPAALSHLAIGVSFLVAFAGPPFGLGGTLWLLLMVYVAVFLPEASVSATSASVQIGKDLVEASVTSAASDGRTFRKITLPLMAPGLVSGWALIFVLIAGEVTASALLAGIGKPVIGFVILDIWEAGTFGDLAALASSFAILNLAVVSFATWLVRARYRTR